MCNNYTEIVLHNISSSKSMELSASFTLKEECKFTQLNELISALNITSFLKIYIYQLSEPQRASAFNIFNTWATLSEEELSLTIYTCR